MNRKIYFNRIPNSYKMPTRETDSRIPLIRGKNSIFRREETEHINGRPVKCKVLCIGECNLSCTGCAIKGTGASLNKCADIEEESIVLTALLEAIKNGYGIIFDGGEPTSCEALERLILTIKFAGGTVVLRTNAIKTIDVYRLVKLCDKITIKVYGNDRDEYRKITGVTMPADDLNNLNYRLNTEKINILRCEFSEINI